MKKTTRKIISSILIILLALTMIASVVLPAFAAEDDTPVATGVTQSSAESFNFAGFIQGFRAPTATHIIALVISLAITVLLIFLAVKGIRFLVYRSNAKKLAAKFQSYVQMTGLPYNLIISHFAHFANTNCTIKMMKRHFLEELYDFLLVQKSTELAKADAAASKDKEHLATRSGVYLKVLKNNYTFNMFTDLIPSDTDATKLL